MGGTLRGISLQTRGEARIIAPTDGWVVYAGPFRSYGQLLIINAGGGYHAENGDDVLQRLVALQDLLHLARDGIVLLAHDHGREHA